MAVIGVNGMLSGVASLDFGGKRARAPRPASSTASCTSAPRCRTSSTANLLPDEGSAASKIVDNWYAWPIAMLPVAVVGIVLSLTVWNARVGSKSAAH